MTYTLDPQSTSRKTGPLRIQAVCSACNQKVVFHYIGKQTWPEKVAKALGMAATVTLWRCGNCNTTLTIEQE